MFRHIQRRLRRAFRKCAETCFHNKSYNSSQLSVGVCYHPENKGSLCDDRFPDLAQGIKSCSLWEAAQGKQQIKADFLDSVESRSRGDIAADYPDIAALLWVLDENADSTARCVVDSDDSLWEADE